ncbi:putative BSD domain-containing protein [Rosa chinensis]|uniref:Putative BSD domain-containing protein n=1 Tax=Rosa chinensis TaxID=74649 RepID=A0A2P6PUE2_ROSCH|nr:uncharacterized protein LOC112169061 [Rosa chinensis]PRQ25551.1 putative BSD domain-containing protein [Rosa chinensis]
MDLSSWFRRNLLRNTEKTQNPDPPKPNEPEQELLGVTEQLINHVKSFTLETFKTFPLPDDEGATSGDNSLTTSSNIQKDLSEWQERHAMFVLSKVKELSHLRYKLCPGHMKEHQFWRVYFMLVKKQVAEYELRAIQLARLKEVTMENERSSAADGCEVEMAEAKHNAVASLAPTNP